MKRAIFTYYNYQINPQIPKLHHEVVRKYNNVENCDFYPLEYTKPDGQMFPDDAIHYGMRELFVEKEYDDFVMELLNSNIFENVNIFDLQDEYSFLELIKSANLKTNGRN